MLNQYYEFLTNSLIRWLDRRSNLKAGDKYFILLDNQEDTKEFYQTLKQFDFSGKTGFYSSQFNYETVAFQKNGVKVLFVAPTENVTQDFLVTVRNRVNANQNEWKDTAVFFVVHNALDSIIGGAYDVSQKDAPFHTENIKKEVIIEIEKSQIKDGEKLTLEQYLNEITTQSMTVLKDYETLFSILEAGKILPDDFNTMGYFPDTHINTYDKMTIKKRLVENQELFSKIETIHQFSDVKDRLNEEFQGLTVIQDLSKEDDWKNVEFSRVYKAKEDFQKNNVRNIEINAEKIVEDDNNFWFRLHGQTKSQRRKAHILVSSTVCSNNIIEFDIPFDDGVRRADLDMSKSFVYSAPGISHKDFEFTASNKRIHVKINGIDTNKTYGGQIHYQHFNMNNLKFIITFMIVPFQLSEIKHLRPDFQIKIMGNRKNRRYYYGISNQNDQYKVGSGEQRIELVNKSTFDGMDISNSTITISEDFSGDTLEDVRFETRIGQFYFPIELMDFEYKSIPAQALTIERQRLGEKNNQFIYQNNKIYTGSKNISVEKTYQEVLALELEIIKQRSLSGVMIDNIYQNVDLNIPVSVRQAYKKLFDYYDSEETTLSLAVSNEEHISLLKNIVSTINDELSNNLQNHKPLNHSIRDLSLIGVIKDRNTISINPLNPLQISYQLELLKELDMSLEIPREAVLATLNTESLLPYVKVSDQHYQATYTKSYPRWMFYNKLAERQLSDLSSNIIKRRLDDYLNQYKFLFSTNPNMVLNVAAIDIIDEENFFDAIINFIVDRISEVNDLGQMNPINLYVNKVGNSLNSLFHQLYKLNTMDELNNLLKNTISKRSYSEYEDYEIIELLQHNINMFRLPHKNSKQYNEQFFHITFYQFAQKDNINYANMHNIRKNYALSGLLNNNQFYLIGDQYLNGFGLGKSTSRDSNLIKFSSLWNSFISSTNKVTDIYQENLTLVNYIPQLNQAELDSVFVSSGWVTLLNLDVDLSYFYDDSKQDLLVIHYSDQNASNQYESVTVTNNIQQYDYLLNLYIKNYSSVENINTNEIIKNFNAINGQWLLRLISDKQRQRGNQHVFREKLSIISAYKELLGILSHQDIFWVPIALEEVLRVSGMVGLSKTEGLFSAKNLGHSGSTSDDLLMMGVEFTGEVLKLHFLPVEVKIGINDSSVRIKAKAQIENTYNLLMQFLSDENTDVFMKKYYLNFFVSMMTSNLEKMVSSGIYTVDTIINYEEIEERLRMGNFELSNEMLDYYGKGVIFEFTKDQNARTSQRLSDANISLIKVPEIDAYNVVSYNTRKVIHDISSGLFDFDSDFLLSNKKVKNEINYHPIDTDTINTNSRVADSEVISQDEAYDHIDNFSKSEEYSFPLTENLDYSDSKLIEEQNYLDTESKQNDAVVIDEIKNNEAQIKKLSEKRLLIGKVLNSNFNINWEYGHRGLANRHMLITGKSGQGKTYFIQTLLHEFSKKMLNVLIVDYTDGFLPNQLDTKLLQSLGDRIRHKIIYQDLMPLNPFKIQKIDLGGLIIEEQPLDMVERVVQIIDFVFNLGVQQRTLLTENILEGYRLNGQSYTFSHLREDLVNSEDTGKQNLYGRISTLLKRDPFSYDNNFSWKDVFNNTGEIHIFQLKGFQRQIQQVMIEFMMWDLFQYATKSGTEDTPLPIVLDEIQNLNFSANSPAVKILREGRKFGLSGIFATQSLDSMKGTDSEAIYNAAQQVHFLPPDSQVKNLAKSMTSSAVDAREVESQLKTLHKGEAIINGPALNNYGQLSPPQRNVVKITSFEERLDRP